MCSGAMPIPVSATVNSNHSSSGGLKSSRAETVTCPSVVNLHAFDTRCDNTCLRRAASISDGPGGSVSNSRRRLSLGLGRCSHLVHEVAQQSVQVDEVARDPHVPRVDDRHVEDVVDQPQQLTARGADPFEIRQEIGQPSVTEVVRHQLRVAHHRIQRRAQLVAHVGDEGALRAARGLGSILGYQQFGLGSPPHLDLVPQLAGAVAHAMLQLVVRTLQLRGDLARA